MLLENHSRRLLHLRDRFESPLRENFALLQADQSHALLSLADPIQVTTRAKVDGFEVEVAIEYG